MYFIPVSKNMKLCESTHLYTQHFHNWGFYHKDTFLSCVFYSESHYAQFLTVSTPGRHTASAGGTLPSQWQDKSFPHVPIWRHLGFQGSAIINHLPVDIPGSEDTTIGLRPHSRRASWLAYVNHVHHTCVRACLAVFERAWRLWC